MPDKRDVLCVGKNMERGLKQYMVEIGDEYLKIIPREVIDVNGLLLYCNNCGSTGPFRINAEYFDQNWRDNVNAFQDISYVKCKINVTPDGGIKLYMLGKPKFDVDMFNEYLNEEYSIDIRECLRCERCGCSGSVDIESDQGIEYDTLEYTGNYHLLTDDPTDVKKDSEGNIVDSSITHDGLIRACHDCFAHDQFVEYYMKVINFKSKNEIHAYLDSYGGLCARMGDGCMMSQDFYHFRITPREIFNAVREVNTDK